MAPDDSPSLRQLIAAFQSSYPQSAAALYQLCMEYDEAVTVGAARMLQLIARSAVTGEYDLSDDVIERIERDPPLKTCILDLVVLFVREANEQD